MSHEGDPLGLVGTTILDKYAVESVVGEGGFAIVYRANHTLWKRPVAVKVFKALGDVDAKQRKALLDDFIQEGALLAALSERSTAICQARDVGSLKTPAGDEMPYMVLEWLEGRSLEAILEEEHARSAPPWTIERAAKLLGPVAEALSLAHKRGIVHRDVKPANVFVLAEKGEHRDDVPPVKLLDFGIAKVVQDAQKMGFGKTAGHVTSFTPLYAAPEQFNRSYGATGPWTDVFALALVLTEMLTGRAPLDGDDLIQLAYAAANPNERPTPRARGASVPDAVEEVFAHALAVKPAERYQNAFELWNALRQALGEPLASSERELRVAGAPRQPTRSDPQIAEAQTLLQHAPPAATSSPAMASAAPAAVSAAPPAVARTPATKNRTSRAGLVVGGAIAVAALGGLFVLRGGSTPKDDAGPAASGSRSTSAPSASAPTRAPVIAPVSPAMTCPEGMVLVPGGVFYMGSDQKDATDDEKPAHKVRLSPYCIDRHEVTVAQYRKCSDGGGCLRAGKENVWPGITEKQRAIYDPLCNANDPTLRAEHPVNCVDWQQARTYCKERGGRLPTEAEWEFAALGPDGRTYPWGDEPPDATHLNACGTECVAWMKANPDPDQPAKPMYDADDGFAATAPVGKFPAGRSRYGLDDIVGNVGEWVADYKAPYARAGAEEADPTGPTKGTLRVVRGGGWNGAEPAWVRPSFRFAAAESARIHGIGFRCAASPSGGDGGLIRTGGRGRGADSP